MVDDGNLIRRMCASDPFTVAATPPAVDVITEQRRSGGIKFKKHLVMRDLEIKVQYLQNGPYFY